MLEAIVLAALIVLGFAAHRKYKEVKDGETAPSFTPPPEEDWVDDTIVRSQDYKDVMSKYDSISSQRDLTDRESIEGAGLEGELMALAYPEYHGRCVTYLNVGVKYEGQKCELDLVVITPYGIMLVEVKNYKGDYTYADGEGAFRPNAWVKNTHSGTTKITRSPISQACRAKRIFSDAMKAASGRKIPIFSYVLFTNDSFSMGRIVDDRLPWSYAGAFNDVCEGFVHGLCPGFTKPLEPTLIANILDYFDQCGMTPVFFDSSFPTNEVAND